MAKIKLNWKASLIGAAVIILLGFLLSLIFGSLLLGVGMIIFIVPALIGGLVAGWLSRADLASELLIGFFAGAIAAIIYGVITLALIGSMLGEYAQYIDAGTVYSTLVGSIITSVIVVGAIAAFGALLGSMLLKKRRR